jgi:non-ribosomal peptide synthetase component E (peptide arylation enzyme)
VPAGERGEIVLRGPKVFKGYWRDPDATRTAFDGGWFHTGDLGVMDDDGYLYIVDRLKDMLVSGGENTASSEVERVLHEHEAVLEAAVVVRPDDRWGGGLDRVRRVARPRDDDAERARPALQRSARALQGSERGAAHRSAPAEPVGKDPQARAERALHRLTPRRCGPRRSSRWKSVEGSQAPAITDPARSTQQGIVYAGESIPGADSPGTRQ